MAHIAFIGLGRMGAGMAARLIDAGHRVTVYNRTPARALPLIEAGAHACDTPQAAAAGADAVISMVADDAASHAVWLGPHGILAADLAPGGLAIECSTLSHAWVLDLAARCVARAVRYVDAPVTGLPDAARAGSLTLLIGAAPDDLRAARPVLECLSERSIHFGPVGAGTAYKLIINLVGAVQIASAAEGLAMAERAGLDVQTVADAICDSQAASPQVVRNVRRMAAGDHTQNIVFSAALRLKDVRYALRLADQVGAAAPFGAVADKLLELLCARGEGGSNESMIVEPYRAADGAATLG